MEKGHESANNPSPMFLWASLLNTLDGGGGGAEKNKIETRGGSSENELKIKYMKVWYA